MKIHLFLAVAMVAALTACASGVKLDETPVEDRTGSTVGATAPSKAGTLPAATADAGAASRSGVAAVDLAGTSQAGVGPSGIANVVYFDYDSFVVKPEFQLLIESHARFLKANASRKIVIEGHTDERGGREYNLALGQKRSEAVRRAFNLLGVPETQVEAVSFGKEKPAVSGNDEATLAKNRRAEVAYR